MIDLTDAAAKHFSERGWTHVAEKFVVRNDFLVGGASLPDITPVLPSELFQVLGIGRVAILVECNEAIEVDLTFLAVGTCTSPSLVKPINSIPSLACLVCKLFTISHELCVKVNALTHAASVLIDFNRYLMGLSFWILESKVHVSAANHV